MVFLVSMLFSRVQVMLQLTLQPIKLTGTVLERNLQTRTAHKIQADAVGELLDLHLRCIRRFEVAQVIPLELLLPERRDARQGVEEKEAVGIQSHPTPFPQ